MRAVEGKNVSITAFKSGEGYIPFACATSCSINIDTEIIKKTVVGSGGWRDNDTRLTEWSGSINTITHIVPSTMMYTVFDVSLATVRKEGLDIQMTFEDSEGNIMALSGHILFPHIGITAGADGFSEDTIEFVGSGPLTISETLITPPSTTTNEVIPGDFYTTGTETEKTLPAGLIGKTLIGVWRESGSLDIITVGTPGPKEVKFDSATPKITWYADAPGGNGEYWYYQYK